MAKKMYLSNDEMAAAFGGYDYRILDMKEVCKAQRALTLKECRAWFQSLPINPVKQLAFLVDFDFMLMDTSKPHPQKLKSSESLILRGKAP